MKLFICGFMGAGKSTLFKKLSNEVESGVNCVDLDELIFERYSQGYSSLGELIRGEGWEKFRAWESECLNELLANGPCLVSLGGGALKDSNILLFSQNKATLLYVETPIEECWERVKDDSNRPLVSQGFQAFKELFEERKPLYEQAGKTISGCDAFPPLEDLL